MTEDTSSVPIFESVDEVFQARRLMLTSLWRFRKHIGHSLPCYYALWNCTIALTFLPFVVFVKVLHHSVRTHQTIIHHIYSKHKLCQKRGITSFADTLLSHATVWVATWAPFLFQGVLNLNRSYTRVQVRTFPFSNSTGISRSHWNTHRDMLSHSL